MMLFALVIIKIIVDIFLLFFVYDDIQEYYYYFFALDIANYILSIISDPTGQFFKNYYESFLYGKEAADILTQIKLNLQQLGGEIEPLGD